MKRAPILLDLYCCAGGGAKGFADAGFTVVGVDIDKQPRYPYPIHRGDVMGVLADLIFGAEIEFVSKDGESLTLTLDDIDAIHASPPCQTYSRTQSLHANTHPQLIEPTRELLDQIGKPWTMENVPGAPLIDPLVLDGRHFGMTAPDVDGVMLKVVRTRLFESNFPLAAPDTWFPNEDLITASVYGNGGSWSPRWRDNPDRAGGYIVGKAVGSQLFGIDWMTKHELSQSIPPVFTEFVGKQLLARVEEAGDE